MPKLTATEARLAAAIRSQGYPITDQQVKIVVMESKPERKAPAGWKAKSISKIAIE